MAQVEIEIVGKDSFSGVLSNFGNIMTGIKSTIDLVAGAFNAVVDFGSQFVDSSIEGELAIANLEATLQSMGDVTGLSSQQLQDMAGALQEVTRFSDETIMNGQAMLLTFGNIGGDVFPRATEAMLDLAAKFGSVEQASVMLGKALNDPIAGVTALRRVGVQLSEQQEEAIKKFMELGDIESAQGIILAELERQVGGLAEAYGNTFAGKVDILKNRLDEIKETIGNGLTPVLATLVDKFTPFIPTLEKFADLIGTVFATLNVGLQEDNWTFFFGALDRLDNFVGGIFQKIADEIDKWASGSGPQELSNKIIAWIEDLGTDEGSKSKIVTAVGNIFTAIGDAIGEIDWSGIAVAIDERVGAAIEAHDWGVSGQNFGRGIENSFKSWLEGDTTNPSSNIVTALGNAISEWFLGAMNQPDWETAGQTFLEIIKQFVIAPLGDLGQSIDDTLNNFFSDLFNVAEIRQGWIEIGVALVDGISTGLSEGIDGLIANATNFWRTFINNAKAVFGIASPSTVFFNIGRDIVLGLIGGFGSMVGSLASVVNSIVDTVLNLFQPVLDVLGLDFNTGTGGATGDATGVFGTGGTTGSGVPGIPAPSGTMGGTVVNQYFAGATINVGSWDQIAYDCIYPNPFVGSTSGQLGGGGGGGGMRL